MVPSEALILSRNGLSVAVVEKGVVHIRKLTVLRDLGTSIEVNDGVKSGDRIILDPPADLSEGLPVNSREVGSPDIGRAP